MTIAMKKLFLAHHSGDAHELWEQAIELRLRGIIPWVDKAGGFAVADESETAARRAIREDCFGLLLYATASVFDRPFIRDVEVNEALKVRQQDAHFALFAVPRGISHDDLKTESRRGFSFDLGRYHTVAIPDGTDLQQGWSKVASEVLQRVLASTVPPAPVRQLSLQYSTRELMPHEPDDVLCIDATALLRNSSADPAQWQRLLRGLQDVKRAISQICGRPRLRINGSKHLSAAFLFGRVFAPFDLDIRQTPIEFWSTDAPIATIQPFTANVQHSSDPHGRLYLEIASGYKNIAAGVDTLIVTSGQEPSVRLRLQPSQGPLNVDNALCRAMVKQTYAELERVVQTRSISELHIFAAVPQSFMMMLGRELKGMPPVQLYEWDGYRYASSCAIPAGVL
jgi:hypothetical protein